MSSIPRQLRALVAFAFVCNAAEAAVIPLLPAIRADLGLSGLETGAVVSATTLAMLVTAVPIGLAAGRAGGAHLLRGAAVLLPVSVAAAALAPGLAALLAARAGLGLSLAVLWVLGPLRASAAGRGARGTGVLIGAAGAGWLVGPLASGVASDLAGWRAPLLGLAVLAAPVVAALRLDRGTEEPRERVRFRDAAEAMRREPAVAGAVVVSAVLGIVAGASSILAPTVLAGNGVSAGGIGAILAASAALWTFGAPLFGRAAVDLRLAGIALGVLGVAWALPAFSLSTGVVVSFVLLSAAARAAVNTFAYVLGAGAGSGHSAAPAVLGVMMLSWTIGALVTPLAIGAAESETAVRLVFAAVAAIALGSAAWLVTARRRAPLPA